MNTVLLVIIALQIGAFQFLSVGFTRSIFAAILGSPPTPLSSEVESYLGKAARYRYILGGIFYLTLVLALVLVPAGSGQKLFLAAASVLSSAVLVLGAIRDRRAVREFRDALPEGGLKRASLEPRSMRQHYHPAWEAVPFLVTIFTLGVTLWSGRGFAHHPTEMWLYVILQWGFVLGAFLYSYRYGNAVPNVSARLAMFRNRPDVALQFGKQLATREVQYFMFAKIFVALLLGVAAVRSGLGDMNSGIARPLALGSWTIVAILLLAFGAYVADLIRLTKQAQGQIQENGAATNGNE